MDRQCSICGSTDKLVDVSIINEENRIFDYGYWPHINQDTIISTTIYCDVCFNAKIWNKKEGQS